MLETVSLLLLVDLPLEFPINGTGFSFLVIVELVLDHPAQMMQEPDRAHCRRPIAVGANTVQKLLGIRIAVLRCGGQIGDGLFVILLDLFAIEIEFSELVFRIVVSILHGNLKVTDRPEDILYLRFGESDLSDKIPLRRGDSRTLL